MCGCEINLPIFGYHLSMIFYNQFLDISGFFLNNEKKLKIIFIINLKKKNHQPQLPKSSSIQLKQGIPNVV
jgi:hypothetical protein